MLLIAGISPRLKQLGIAGGKCPACGVDGRLHIVKQSQSLSVFFIPVFHFGREYIVTCASCASVMELSEDAGKRFESGSVILNCHEMRIIKNNKGIFCSSCGQRVHGGYAFCPNCGKRQ